MERRRIAALRSRLALAAALVGTLGACGGGGGDGGGGGTPTDPGQGVFFTANGSGGANRIVMAGRGDAAATTFTLEVRADRVEELYAAAFDLEFPASLLGFNGAAEGDFLAEGGTVPTSLQVAESAPGNLVIGLSRLGDVGGRSGSGLLLSLSFQVVASGSGDLTFARNTAFGADGAPMPGVGWSGGSIRIVR